MLVLVKTSYYLWDSGTLCVIDTVFDRQANSLQASINWRRSPRFSEDGTMVAVLLTEPPQTPEHSAAAGTSDTESISGRENEVRGAGT